MAEFGPTFSATQSDTEAVVRHIESNAAPEALRRNGVGVSTNYLQDRRVMRLVDGLEGVLAPPLPAFPNVSEVAND